MSTLQLFDFEGHQIDWGKDEQGNPICEARQLGKILGFSPSYVSEVVSRIYPQFKFQSAMGKPGRPSWYLREPGIYQMIFESKSDIAQRFQCWVYSEVLPKLRASGGYIMPNATSKELELLGQQLVETASTEESITPDDYRGMTKYIVQCWWKGDRVSDPGWGSPESFTTLLGAKDSIAQLKKLGWKEFRVVKITREIVGSER